jgi:ATP-dependent DNA helicase RecQ
MPKAADSKSVSSRGDQTRVTPAKEEAWRMWQEEGISFSAIANLPDRPKPIKEDTVIEYISECVKAGYEVDWERFCHDADFTAKKALEVEVAVLRAGSTEFLKPIKEQSAEFVTYRDIKIYLLMLERGFPLPVSPAPITDRQDITTPIDTAADELLEGTADALGSQKSDSKSEVVLDQSPSGVFTTPPWLPQTGSDEMTLTGLRRRMPSWTSQEKIQTSQTPAKKVKTSPTQAPDDGRIKAKAAGGERATEEKLVQWLMTMNGVTRAAILSQFPGTDERALLDLLQRLEEDFVIYVRNELFRVM